MPEFVQLEGSSPLGEVVMEVVSKAAVETSGLHRLSNTAIHRQVVHFLSDTGSILSTA
jgi:hypothetical protein